MAIAATETGPEEAAVVRKRNPAILAVDDEPAVLAAVARDLRRHFGDSYRAGLGLDTVRRIIEERHRGTIEVESRPGLTTFRVWLALADAAR